MAEFQAPPGWCWKRKRKSHGAALRRPESKEIFMWGQPPSAVQSSEARRVSTDRTKSPGLARPDSRGRLSPHGSWRNYGLATTLGHLLGARQRADRRPDPAAGVLHLSRSQTGAGQRSVDRATRGRSRDGQNPPSQNLALQTVLGQGSTPLAISASD